jgi:hypothetical protein
MPVVPKLNHCMYSIAVFAFAASSLSTLALTMHAPEQRQQNAQSKKRLTSPKHRADSKAKSVPSGQVSAKEHPVEDAARGSKLSSDRFSVRGRVPPQKTAGRKKAGHSPTSEQRKKAGQHASPASPPPTVN